MPAAQRHPVILSGLMTGIPRLFLSFTTSLSHTPILFVYSCMPLNPCRSIVVIKLDSLSVKCNQDRHLVEVSEKLVLVRNDNPCRLTSLNPGLPE